MTGWREWGKNVYYASGKRERDWCWVNCIYWERQDRERVVGRQTTTSAVTGSRKTTHDVMDAKQCYRAGRQVVSFKTPVRWRRRRHCCPWPCWYQFSANRPLFKLVTVDNWGWPLCGDSGQWNCRHFLPFFSFIVTLSWSWGVLTRYVVCINQSKMSVSDLMAFDSLISMSGSSSLPECERYCMISIMGFFFLPRY